MFSRRQIAIGLLKLLLGVFAALIVLVLVLMVLFTEENWRGRRVLVRCEEGLRARGEKLELASFIPPPVAEAENFWMAPLLVPLATATQEELDRKPKAPGSPLQRLEKIDLSRAGDSPKMPRSGDYELGQPIDLVAWQRYLHQDTRQNPTLDQREAAHAVLAWLGRWSAELDEFSAAASRPSARFPLDYSKGFGMPMPHLMLLTRFAQVYRLRCVAAFEAGNIAFALQDLQTSDQIQAAIRSEPLLISYLVRLTMIKSLMQPIWQGLVERVWDEDQLQDIQAALARIDLISDYAWVARGERAVANLTYSKFRASRGSANSLSREYLSWLGASRQYWMVFLPDEAVMCQNQVTNERWVQEYILPVVDGAAHRVYPAKENEAGRVSANSRTTPYNMLAKMSAAVVNPIVIRAAATQSAVDQAIVGSALERFRLRTGRFPNSLDDLVPQYLEVLPRDVIDGAALRYRSKSGDAHIIYSVGWNQSDEGGAIVPKGGDSPRRDNEKGDWVWLSTLSK